MKGWKAGLLARGRQSPDSEWGWDEGHNQCCWTSLRSELAEGGVEVARPWLLTPVIRGCVPCRLHFPQLALRRRLGQLSCMSRPALKLRSWPLTVLYYLLPFGALRPLSRVGWRPVSRVSVCRLLARTTAGQPEVGTQETQKETVGLEVMAEGLAGW